MNSYNNVILWVNGKGINYSYIRVNAFKLTLEQLIPNNISPLFICSKKLDEATAELKKMAMELENEKGKTDRLLHEMLPKKVADQLKQGQTVEAGNISTENIRQIVLLFDQVPKQTLMGARAGYY